MLSFWEQQTYLEYDFIVAGAGIMGCSVAYELRLKYPKARIVVLERGLFPTGASTKNAGFACFGSPTEIISDFKLHGPQKALDIISNRYEGLKILISRLGSDHIGLTSLGGYELIFSNPLSKVELEALNETLMSYFKSTVFLDISSDMAQFGFRNVRQLLFCPLESQIDSGKMMQHYWNLLQLNNIQIHTGAEVKNIQGNLVEIVNAIGGTVTLKSDCITLCTNAFINEIMTDVPVKPGRGQVIITNEIKDLPFKGSFHFDEGYYYFRNVGKRVLFGGGRNLDFQTETSTKFENNAMIINDLKGKLNEIILPDYAYKIEHEWQGIMGFSESKAPLMMKLNAYTNYIMACNGMGVALSPFMAKELVAGL